MKNQSQKASQKPGNKGAMVNKKAAVQPSQKKRSREESDEESNSVSSNPSEESEVESEDEEDEEELVYSSRSGDEGAEESDGVEDGEGRDEAKGSGGDGFANVLNKILNQNIGNKNPVLAKRKTQIMKEQEAHSHEVKEEKRRRLSNKQEREKQMVAPSYITLDYERQLKKVATRGVIALFNAIHKAKKDDMDAEEKTHRSSSDAKAAPISGASDIKALTQEKFLELLKHGKGAESSDAKKDNISSSASGSKEKAAKQAAESGKGWGAVKDDFLLDKKIALKDWDKESDSDENAGDFADDDHVEIDSDAEPEAPSRGAGKHKHAPAKRGGGKSRR